MLLAPRQRRLLSEIAKREGRSVAEVTREMIDLGLRSLEEGDLLARRRAAMARIERLREGVTPFTIDADAGINRLREERDERNARGGD